MSDTVWIHIDDFAKGRVALREALLAQAPDAVAEFDRAGLVPEDMTIRVAT
jgi:hypothetical protein